MIPTSPLKGIKPGDLPSPPQAALKIMRACSNDKVDISEVSALAAQDPMLTAELLRVVNSSFFGLSRTVQSIPRAVTVIGQRALRNLALCVSVRDAIKAESLGKGFDLGSFWEDGLRRAVCARLLAQQLNLDADECFTAGLLQDFGLLVLFFTHREKCDQWPILKSEDPDRRLAMEEELFQSTHETVGAELARLWQLPDELSVAIAHHHTDTANLKTPPTSLTRVIRCGDWMSAVYSAENKGAVIDRCRQVLQQEFALDVAQSDELLAEVPRQMEEAAKALGLGLSAQTDFGDVLRQANVKLAEANLSYQQLTWKLEQALTERDRLQEELNRELDLGREIQRSLLPQDQPTPFPVHGVNISARHVSGDFYDFFVLKDGRIYFNLGDVSGKGVNAALLMAKTSSLFHCLGKDIDDPAELVERVNEELCESSIRGMFVTLCAGLFEPQSGKITLVNAGHMPALIISSNGKFAKLEAQGPPLGVLSGVTYPSRTFSIGNNCLYLYSDGVTEGRTKSGEMLGFDGFISLCLASAKLSPAQRMDTIVAKLTEQAQPLHDDVTLLILEQN